MKPVKQTKLSSLDGKIRGNCFRACLASIMEIGIDDIPPLEEYKDGEWHIPFLKWLDSVGLEYNGLRHKPTSKDLEEEPGIEGYHIAGGKSPREHVKNGHGVVFYKDSLVHDPHPSNDGILTLDFIYLINRKKNEN